MVVSCRKDDEYFTNKGNIIFIVRNLNKSQRFRQFIFKSDALSRSEQSPTRSPGLQVVSAPMLFGYESEGSRDSYPGAGQRNASKPVGFLGVNSYQ